MRCRSGWSVTGSRRSRRLRRCRRRSSVPDSAMSNSERYQLPEEALEERFLAASGPGGQNVNKVATACQLRCDVFRLGLAPDVYQRLRELAGRRVAAAGEVALPPPRHPTREDDRRGAGTGEEKSSTQAP